MTTPCRAVIYARVSTDEQTTDNQVIELRAVAARMGHEVVKVYLDNGVSGAKGRDGRPGFDALCRAMTRREFDVVMVWAVDRLSRSIQDLVHFLNELHATGADLYIHTQGIDTRTPGGRALFQMLGVFGELERALIQERVRSGMRRAKAEGRHVGRPPLDPALKERIRAALAEPNRDGVRQIAARFKVSVGSVQGLKNRAP